MKGRRAGGKLPDARLAAALIGWFQENARDLPWRRTLDPYAVWVSEIMLQQTQVKTVIPYFERWMRALPDVAALANASSPTIHKLWEGLGYYTRVRNMQRAAQVIVQQHGGTFPECHEEVLALSGIGRYTAGAICSIAFNQPAPIVDGNVIRVLTRVFGIEGNARERDTIEQLWRIAQELVACARSSRRQEAPSELRRKRVSGMVFSGACSVLNQALMELGATLCTPRAPQCESCPVKRLCIARREDRVETLPNLEKRARATARRFAAVIVQRLDRVLVRQRPAGVVNGHLWEFPNVEVPLKASRAQVEQAIAIELGCSVTKLESLAAVKHSITRYRITLEAFAVELNGGKPAERAGSWIEVASIGTLPFTSAHRRLAGQLLKE